MCRNRQNCWFDTSRLIINLISVTIGVLIMLSIVRLLASPPLSERRRYCDKRRHAVCVSDALVSAAKVRNALYPTLSSLYFKICSVALL